MLLPSTLTIAFPILMAWGLYDLSQAYWAKQRSRGPAYWQAMLNSERRNRG